MKKRIEKKSILKIKKIFLVSSSFSFGESKSIFSKSKFIRFSPYARGVSWSLLAFFISALNDTIVKLSSLNLPAINVLFFRFLFSALILLPLVLRKKETLKTKHLGVHSLRGFLFTLAMIPWCFGLISLPLPLVTVISFTTSLFVVLLAGIFLREAVGWQRWLATCGGFLGIVFSVGYAPLPPSSWSFVLLAFLATLLFATLDILNKNLLMLKESMLSMMFFSSIFTTIFLLPLVLFSWVTPSFKDLLLLLVLGLGANGFLACLLKASSAYDVSALQTLRYSELLFSSLLSILVFQTAPSWSLYIGMLFIVPSTLYLGRHELLVEKKKTSL